MHFAAPLLDRRPHDHPAEVRFTGAHLVDPTGLGRASTRSFFPHHLASIAAAVVFADALVLENAAASLAFQSVLTALPPGTAPRAAPTLQRLSVCGELTAG